MRNKKIRKCLPHVHDHCSAHQALLLDDFRVAKLRINAVSRHVQTLATELPPFLGQTLLRGVGGSVQTVRISPNNVLTDATTRMLKSQWIRPWTQCVGRVHESNIVGHPVETHVTNDHETIDLLASRFEASQTQQLPGNTDSQHSSNRARGEWMFYEVFKEYCMITL